MHVETVDMHGMHYSRAGCGHMRSNPDACMHMCGSDKLYYWKAT
jgi:hypothetical protein